MPTMATLVSPLSWVKIFDACADMKLSLGLSLMQHKLGFNTEYFSERSGHEQSTVMSNDFTIHTSCLNCNCQWSANLEGNLVTVPCEQSSSLWSCGHWTSILLFAWHAVKTASWWPSFSIKTSKVGSHGMGWIESFVYGAASQVLQLESIHTIQCWNQPLTDVFGILRVFRGVTVAIACYHLVECYWMLEVSHKALARKKKDSN